jgi:phosphoglycolate phosphatase-like HAD superfamily hydrolase
MKKLQLLLLIACLAAPAMAQEKFELGKPGNDAYRYLDQYKGLKEYIDHEKYPNFKLGIATENLNNSLVKNLISKNASETVAGNGKKVVRRIIKR